jgi:transcription elongation factor GreA
VTLVFQLVMPEDADGAKGLISTTSPIGRAFLNKEPGDSVKVITPGGTREFEIVKLFTIHDEAPE